MDSIDTIPMTTYGLYVSKQKGNEYLLEQKTQFFTAFYSEGHQITKRKGNVLDIIGFIKADDLADFNTKTAALYTKITSPNVRAFDIDGVSVNCFNTEGYKIDKVHVFSNAVYARIKIKMTVVA